MKRILALLGSIVCLSSVSQAAFDIGAVQSQSSPLSATLTIPATSTTYTFTDQATPASGPPTVGGDAVDMGDYAGPYVCQHNHRQISSDGKWVLDFRPDCPGGRVEVVVWRGSDLETVSSTVASNILDPMTLTVTQGTTTSARSPSPIYCGDSGSAGAIRRPSRARGAAVASCGHRARSAPPS